ncbi:hypothetical protein D0Z07_8100 [Hyphodiscus hymeniophilus]|uniref:Gag1-like clamp domain-containing protein n=1 Tax=Hyphodiscus hymeniophilus TaxID=353542 RepID=A0A9P6VE51_9HELO|nr:hypothetical protein D0Z07_8100 [Hyphodiscus hymeniophilus]
MAPDHSAAGPGAAESQIGRGQGAHDMLQIDREEREAIPRGATEAIEAASSLDLESPIIDTTSSAPQEVKQPILQHSSHDGFADQELGESYVTTAAHDAVKPVVGSVNHEPDSGKTPRNESTECVSAWHEKKHELISFSIAALSSTSIVPPSQVLRDTTPPHTSPSPASNGSTVKISASTAASHTQFETSLFKTLSSQQISSGGGAGAPTKPHEGNMLFSYRAPGPAINAHRRRQYANTSALTDYEAELTGKDRAKQKEAVRKLLSEKVRDDWKWVWPRPQSQTDDEVEPQTPPESDVVADIEPKIEPEDDARLSPVQAVKTHESQKTSGEEEYDEQWKERDEWLSNGSESEDLAPVGGRRTKRTQSGTKDNPFRFETPDGIGETVRNSLSERKRRRKKRLAEELAWNNGVKCFTERRDTWTGARRMSRSSPTKDLRKYTSHSSQDGSSTAMDPETEDDGDDDWEADTEVPIAPPLIPPENAMRASITPTAYNTIYDKVILQNLTPSCPINLKDITRSCVQGWKRDGEWPPKASIPDTLGGRRRRKSLASLFGLEKTKSKEDKEKVDKERAEKEAHKDSDDHKPGAFKKFTRKFLLMGKDKDHEHSKEHGNISAGSNGRKESVGEGPAT